MFVFPGQFLLVAYAHALMICSCCTLAATAAAIHLKKHTPSTPIYAFATVPVLLGQDRKHILILHAPHTIPTVLPLLLPLYSCCSYSCSCYSTVYACELFNSGGIKRSDTVRLPSLSTKHSLLSGQGWHRSSMFRACTHIASFHLYFLL